eukprot:4211684-Pyramimonas_sp.AAC.1
MACATSPAPQPAPYALPRLPCRSQTWQTPINRLHPSSAMHERASKMFIRAIPTSPFIDPTLIPDS